MLTFVKKNLRFILLLFFHLNFIFITNVFFYFKLEHKVDPSEMGRWLIFSETYQTSLQYLKNRTVIKNNVRHDLNALNFEFYPT